jgi:hypothetical protein
MQKSVQPNVVNFPVDGFYKVCANALGVISGVKVFFFLDKFYPYEFVYKLDGPRFFFNLYPPFFLQIHIYCLPESREKWRSW